MRLVHADNGKSVKGGNPVSDITLDVSKSISYTGSAGSAPSTVKDANFTTATTTGTTWAESVTIGRGKLSNPVDITGLVLTSSNPAVAVAGPNSVNPTGVAGSTTVTATLPGRGRKTKLLTTIAIPSTSKTSLTGWVAGSLAAHIFDSYNTMMGGVDRFAADQLIFDSVNTAAPAFIRKSNNILASNNIDVTGRAHGNFATGYGSVTAISPLHVIGADHWFPNPLPAAVHFIDANNNVVTRTVVSSVRVANAKGVLTDMRIGLLDTPLPASIKPMQVLPPTYTTYLPSIQHGIPIFILHGWNIRSFAWKSGGDTASYDASGLVFSAVEFYKNRAGYNQGNIPHAGSGSPVFVVINGEPVLLWILHWMGGEVSLGGPDIAGMTAQVNAAMATLSTAAGSAVYTLTTASMAGFTAY